MTETITGQERQNARDVIQHCYKRLRQDYDLLSEKQEIAFRKEIQRAQNALTARDPKLSNIIENLVQTYNQNFPDSKSASLRENGEVILVAFIIAMAFRAFFLQPFKIPTGSMQPTLNGVIVRAVSSEEKQWWYPIVSRPVWGEQRVRLIAQSSGRFEEYKPVSRSFLHYGGKTGFLSIFPVDATLFRIGEDWYEVPVDGEKFFSDIRPLLKSNGDYRQGETILDCVVQTGDQLFVDRFTYNFRKPKRDDVFVFETAGIMYRTQPLHGDFYIKRLGGTPDDTLRIQDGKLFINGELAQAPGFQRVMSKENGYRGYGYERDPPTWLSGPEETVHLKDREYFALGDNSFNSLDSRYWGVVPYQNIVGRAFFVFWPFNRHFGRIH
jgi:signal peptidase I